MLADVLSRIVGDPVAAGVCLASEAGVLQDLTELGAATGLRARVRRATAGLRDPADEAELVATA